MLLPVILYYAIFCYGPMGGTIIAFKNYKPALGITGSKWVGMKYFKAVSYTHLAKRIFPIVRVRVNGSGSFHYVLIVNSDGKEFRCMDPMNPSDSLVPLSDFGNCIYAVRYIYRE